MKVKSLLSPTSRGFEQFTRGESESPWCQGGGGDFLEEHLTGGCRRSPPPAPQGSLVRVIAERPPKSLHLPLTAFLTALMVSQCSPELLKNTSRLLVITNLDDVIELMLLMSPPEG